MPIWVGIDIGKSAVKVAAIRTSYRKMALTGLASVDVPLPLSASQGAASEGAASEEGAAEANANALTSTIREAVARALGTPGSGDGVAVAIDGVKAVTRVLPMPASAQKQMGEVLPFELESQV